MTMRDKIAAVIKTAIDNALMHPERAAAKAILAALPGCVPDLVWEEVSEGFYRATVSEKHPRAAYEVLGNSAVCYALHIVCGVSAQVGGHHPTHDKAKAAANAHHSAAVCKAMTKGPDQCTSSPGPSALRAAGYVRLPAWWVTEEDFQIIKRVAERNSDAVNRIRGNANGSAPRDKTGG